MSYLESAGAGLHRGNSSRWCRCRLALEQSWSTVACLTTPLRQPAPPLTLPQTACPRPAPQPPEDPPPPLSPPRPPTAQPFSMLSIFLSLSLSLIIIFSHSLSLPLPLILFPSLTLSSTVSIYSLPCIAPPSLYLPRLLLYSASFWFLSFNTPQLLPPSLLSFPPSSSIPPSLPPSLSPQSSGSVEEVSGARSLLCCPGASGPVARHGATV